MKLVFLGTGGGRHMMSSQVRATGGMFFDLGNVKFMVDPGPGSLVHARALGLKIEDLDGILVSHLHPDNCSDTNVLLDGMLLGPKKQHFLIAEEHCILPMGKIRQKGGKKFVYYPIVYHYHQGLVKNIHPVKHKDSVNVEGIEVKAYKSEHYDPTVGFVISHPKISIGYTADGPYYKGQEKFYDGCDILILNVLVPKGVENKGKRHMSIDDAIILLNCMKNKPKLVIMQHFSFWMLRANLWKQAKILQDATKSKVLCADDFMEVDLETFGHTILKKKQ